MSSLTDTQTVLLSHAAQRDNGSLYPLPEAITAPAAAVAKSVASLIKRGLAEERETSEPAAVSRTDRDLRHGVFITAAGTAAIGIDDGEVAGTGTAAPDADPPAPRQTKAAVVLGLLQRESGATLPELIAATGWLPHTTRAALTGLRKKGHLVERIKRGEVTCYRIMAAA